MELSQSYYIFLGLICFLGFLGIIGNVQLSGYYNHWISKLKDYEARADLPSQGGTSDLIQEMITEYSKHRSEGIEFVNTQAIIEKKVFQKQISLLGILRLPLNVVEKILSQLPSWAIILGLLGTFSGLTIALFDMQETLLLLGSSSSNTAEIISISTIVAAIAGPFKGMSFAFLTSIAGIGTAFIIHLFHSGLFSKLGIGPSYLQAKGMFLTKCEAYLDHHVQAMVQREKPKDSLERILDRLVDKVKESFEQSVASFGQEILKMTQNLDGSIKGLEKVIQSSYSFSEQFHQGTSQLKEFGTVLQSSIQQFQHQEGKVAERIEQLAVQVGQLQQELKILTTKTMESHQGLHKVLERSDQVNQLSLRKSEEIFKFFHQQMEEIHRRFQERFEEYQRTNKQQQEEWFYKYQDKNDQFSRAAESFGQAVMHLERQWEEGLERFKREVGNQWSHLLEKYFGRQYNQNQDRDSREMLRELESIHHVLEREFQQMHRYTNEMSQILISMYEWGRAQMNQSSRYTQSEARYSQSEPMPSNVVRERRY